MNPPSGTRDFDPKDVLIREDLIERTKKHFMLYGGQPIETPVLESMRTVYGLYGEEFDKQVYHVNVNEEEEEEYVQLLLRYDLTVSWARYAASRGLQNFRRYQIGRVYRRDKPQVSRGRYREFYQADFDILGTDYGQMIHEAEILNLLSDILADLLGKDSYLIKINDRQVMESIFSKLGVPDEMFHGVCSTIDKLDKMSRDEIKDELLRRGLNSETVTNILIFVDQVSQITTPEEVIAYLKTNDYAPGELISQMELLCGLLQPLIGNFKFDLTLARGLDYYTGVVYEAVYRDQAVLSSSVAAGGRYDEMIGKLGNLNVNAIGLSIGLERIVNILEKKEANPIEIRPHVFVASVGKNMTPHRYRLCQELRHSGLIPEMVYTKNPKMRAQLDQVFERIPYMIVIGGNEISAGTLKIKDVEQHTEIEMDRNEGIKFLVDKLLK